MPNQKAPRNSLSIIVLDSAVKANKSIIFKHLWKNAKMNQKR